MRFSGLTLFYFHATEDGPILIWVNESDVNPAKYSVASDGDYNIWNGTGHDGYNNIAWTFTTRNDWTLGAYSRMGFRLEGPSEFGDLVWDNIGYPYDNVWEVDHDNERGTNNPIIFNLPWIATGRRDLHPMTYKEIRDAGHDPYDSAPLTWNYVP